MLPELHKRRLPEIRRESVKAMTALRRFFRLPDITMPMVEEFERRLLPMGHAQLDASHYFGEGVCVRTILFPKGSMAVGAVQKRRHVSIVISGSMTIWTPVTGVYTVKAPEITVVEPGMKRIGYAHEDTLWAVALGIPEELEACSGDDLWKFATANNYDDFLTFINNQKQGKITYGSTSEQS